jgi:hypothetical protein
MLAFSIILVEKVRTRVFSLVTERYLQGADARATVTLRGLELDADASPRAAAPVAVRRDVLLRQPMGRRLCLAARTLHQSGQTDNCIP